MVLKTPTRHTSIRKVFVDGGNMKYVFCWVLAALLTEVHCHRLTETVPTDKGAVQGKILTTVMNNVSYALFTIPYAKEPVRELRFRDPIPPDPWTGVLNATEDSDVCVQYNSLTPVGSEDCLYLNVFTPVLNFTKIDRLLPVMVWIYGGAYVMGSISRETNGPDLFLEDNVVFVDMNYRLGPLGFLSLNMDESRGNQGLKDQNMAMRWVQKNIANFGGDPNRVTLFGESSGAVSVTYHLLSPQSKGLFQQAIFQSGSSICPWGYHTPKQALQAAHNFGAHMGIKAKTNQELLDALTKADIKDIIKAAFKIIWNISALPNLPFNPTIDVIPSDPSPDKVFLDDCPISKWHSGNFTHVPTMLGYNKDEIDLSKMDLDKIRNDMLNRLNKIFASDTAGRIQDFASLLETVVNGPYTELGKIATAFYFTGPIDTTQKLLAKHNGKLPVYYYRLSYLDNPSDNTKEDSKFRGTAHADDIPLLFCNDSAPHLDPNSEYNVYRKQFVSLWTNFAKYGNPTPHNEPVRNGVWLPSGKEGRQIDLGSEEFKMHDRLLDPRIEKFASFYNFVLPHISACRNQV